MRVSLWVALALIAALAFVSFSREDGLAQVSMTPRPDGVTPPAMRTIGSQMPTPGHS